MDDLGFPHFRPHIFNYINDVFRLSESIYEIYLSIHPSIRPSIHTYMIIHHMMSQVDQPHLRIYE